MTSDESKKENIDISESLKAKNGDKFFRSRKGIIKFGLELLFMGVVGFVCIYPLAIFLGNFMR